MLCRKKSIQIQFTLEKPPVVAQQLVVFYFLHKWFYFVW